MKKTVVIIPALNPLNVLTRYVERLLTLNISRIIVVNDGSDSKYSSIFEQLKKINHCIVLEHKVNKGKGRAVKTGLLYVIHQLQQTDFVITVGAHRQHQIEDVEQLLYSAKVFSDGIILGVRSFKSRDVTFQSTIGNKAVSLLFNLLFRRRLLDTQTGLRCISKQHLSWLVNVPGESFSYDTNMLVEAINRKVPIYEVPIGRLTVKKNTIMYYDEIMNMKRVIQQILKNYTNMRKFEKSEQKKRK